MVLAGVLTISISTQPLAAQDELPGVSLGLVYANTYLPALAVQPFIGGFGGDMIASQVEAIVGRDLRNSDQFEVIDSLPDAMVGSQVDYPLWDRLGAVWLVTGEIEVSGDGYMFVVCRMSVKSVAREVKIGASQNRQR